MRKTTIQLQQILSCLLFVCLFLTANSQEKNGAKQINKVLVLGNSIVAHDPKPEIGWTANWGMAASAADSDFVHVLTRKIQSVNSNASVMSKNIAVFENTYTTFDLKTLGSLRDFQPDMIIIKISENVNDTTALANHFKKYYEGLLKYIDPKKRAVKVLVDGFWPRPNVNTIVKQIADKRRYDFVTITYLFDDVTNTAKDKFANAGVGYHPSDKGMRLIAEEIWSTVKKYF